jgi:hypothetical protein
MNLNLSSRKLATVQCLYHPELPDGKILHGTNAHPVLQALAADFVLVPRDLFDTLPEDFRATVTARVG